MLCDFECTPLVGNTSQFTVLTISCEHVVYCNRGATYGNAWAAFLELSYANNDGAVLLTKAPVAGAHICDAGLVCALRIDQPHPCVHVVSLATGAALCTASAAAASILDTVLLNTVHLFLGHGCGLRTVVDWPRGTAVHQRANCDRITATAASIYGVAVASHNKLTVYTSSLDKAGERILVVSDGTCSNVNTIAALRHVFYITCDALVVQFDAILCKCTGTWGAKNVVALGTCRDKVIMFSKRGAVTRAGHVDMLEWTQFVALHGAPRLVTVDVANQRQLIAQTPDARLWHMHYVYL